MDFWVQVTDEGHTIMFKKLILIFLAGFLLNLVWENLHSYLYAQYQGGAITQLVLLRATLFDAVFITLLAALFIKVPYFRERRWYALIFGVIAAVILEKYALNSGRWAYNEFMPVIPLLNTGLTPTLQLGILSHIVFKRWT